MGRENWEKIVVVKDLNRKEKKEQKNDFLFEK